MLTQKADEGLSIPWLLPQPLEEATDLRLIQAAVSSEKRIEGLFHCWDSFLPQSFLNESPSLLLPFLVKSFDVSRVSEMATTAGRQVISVQGFFVLGIPLREQLPKLWIDIIERPVVNPDRRDFFRILRVNKCEAR
jgi:hypothetical protein